MIGHTAAKAALDQNGITGRKAATTRGRVRRSSGRGPPAWARNGIEQAPHFRPAGEQQIGMGHHIRRESQHAPRTRLAEFAHVAEHSDAAAGRLQASTASAARTEGAEAL